MGDLAKFEIRFQPAEAPVVLIDGTELSGVVGAQVSQEEPNALPVVYLEVAAEAVIVKGAGQMTAGAGRSIEEFLESIDPKELQATALAKGNYATPPGETMLELLKELASGSSS